MNTFLVIVPTISRVRFFEVQLEQYLVRITHSFNLTLRRWQMNVENITLGTRSLGITMNQGVDLLNASSTLDLQALVLTNLTQITGLEADPNNLGTEMVYAYMDLDTYELFILKGAIQGRAVYRVPVLEEA